MKYKILEKTDLSVSEICFGCSNLWRDDISLVQKAFDLGVTFFDTADVYGNGKSEEMLGSFFKGIRDRVILTTKVGMECNTFVPKSSKAHFIKSCEDSLRRLQTDYIDIYLVHCFAGYEAISWMKKLQAQGKIRYFGVSNYGSEQLLNSPYFDEVVNLQIRFNYLQQDYYENVKDICKKYNISITAYSPLCKGLMTGKYKGNEVFNKGDDRYNDPMYIGDTFRDYIGRVKIFCEQNRIGEDTPTQVALKWLLSRDVIPIIGVRNVRQVEENVSIS